MTGREIAAMVRDMLLTREGEPITKELATERGNNMAAVIVVEIDEECNRRGSVTNERLVEWNNGLAAKLEETKANLAKQLETARHMLDQDDNIDPDDARELAELVVALIKPREAQR